ncbi:MAG TPA: aminoglycoside phosphotransferase family protein [Roseiflexaceae bacterium]|nr:aminoglycoside phosphotransferase family protein [Roseiflexaceae bacterium]
MEIPERFAQLMRAIYGEAGEVWLAGLPELLAECARRWELELLPPFELSYNYVAPARRADGTPVVLKVGVPNRELLSEIAALRHYDGRGVARLLEADPARGALLLERLLPGEPLVTLADDDRATEIAAGVMRALWRPPPEGGTFPHMADWLAGFGRMRRHFGGGCGPFPAPLVAQAEAVAAELLATADAPVLLHGDLHHFNICAASSGVWLAIDPKGLLGEPAYEVGALLRNPLPQLLRAPEPGRVLERRLDILSGALEIDRARLRDWGMVQALLSAWWSVEDEGAGWEPALAVAELLAAL